MAKLFDEDLYCNKSINNLIIFCLYSALENKEKCTFEKLVGECYLLFPKIFGFSQYPQWPDSRKLDRPLRLLRHKKLISGEPQTSFSLTKKGKEIALEIANEFRQKRLKI